jgi:hypothetical protein
MRAIGPRLTAQRSGAINDSMIDAAPALSPFELAAAELRAVGIPIAAPADLPQANEF